MNKILSILILHFSLLALDFDSQYNSIIKKNTKHIDSWWNKEIKDDFRNQLNAKFKHRAEIKQFILTNLPEASQKQKIFYPFGGPDFFYPDLFFENMDCLCLIGLEPLGDLLTEEILDKISESTFIQMSSIIENLPFKSYFITPELRSFKGLSIEGLLALQVKLRGYELIDIKHINQSIPCLKITYKKNAEDISREIRYYNLNLLSVSANDLEQLFLDVSFDAAFVKATSYVTQDRRCFLLNKFLTSHFCYILQSDSGIPAYRLKNSWNIKMFGEYKNSYLQGAQNISAH